LSSRAAGFFDVPLGRLTLILAPPEAPGEDVTGLSWPIFCSGPQIRPAPQPTPPHPTPGPPLSLPTAPPPHPPPPAAQRALRPTWAAGTTDAPLVLCWCGEPVLASCTGSGCSQRLAGGQVVEGCCCCCGRCRHPTPAPWAPRPAVTKRRATGRACAGGCLMMHTGPLGRLDRCAPPLLPTQRKSLPGLENSDHPAL